MKIYLDTNSKWRLETAINTVTNPGLCGFKTSGENVIIYAHGNNTRYYNGPISGIQFKNTGGNFENCTDEADFRAKVADIDFFDNAPITSEEVDAKIGAAIENVIVTAGVTNTPSGAEQNLAGSAYALASLTELPIGEALNVLYVKIQALEAFIKASQYGNVTADQVDVVRAFNIWGKTNLIIDGTAAPAVVPDFVGQTFINTAGGVTYTAKGNASVADWKQTSN